MEPFEKEIIERLARIEENLKDHIRRTELLEVALTPLKKHVYWMEGGLKVLGILALMAGMVLTVVRLVL